MDYEAMPLTNVIDGFSEKYIRKYVTQEFTYPLMAHMERAIRDIKKRKKLSFEQGVNLVKFFYYLPDIHVVFFWGMFTKNCPAESVEWYKLFYKYTTIRIGYACAKPSGNSKLNRERLLAHFERDLIKIDKATDKNVCIAKLFKHKEAPHA